MQRENGSATRSKSEMTSYLKTIFDVLDNFFGSQDCPPKELLDDGNIEKLRQVILDFYSDFRSQSAKEFETRFYLGGFLSSPPFTTQMAPYFASALLCSDSIVLYDPLHFWFCEEQYKRERLFSAPNGWLNYKTGDPDHPRTRQYLSNILGSFYSLRSLVETGIIVLIPVEKIVFERLSLLSDCRQSILEGLGELELVAKRFPPQEITVDDNRKGMFVFAGGNRREQIQKWIDRGVEQFSKDVLVAACTDSIYVAPFAWEQHLAKESLQVIASGESQSKVVEGIRNLRLPLLANLSPQLVLSIHQDSAFSEFRLSLSEAFRNIHENIGTSDFAIRVEEIERTLLIPKVNKIQEEIQSNNSLRKAVKAAGEASFIFGSTFLAGIAGGATPQLSAYASSVSGGVTFLKEVFKKRAAKGEHRIWARLLPDKPSDDLYLGRVVLQRKGDLMGWEIDDKPSMKFKVSKGLVKMMDTL